MATKNPRVNVTFEEPTVGLLTELAHEENKSVSSLVRELTLDALELREDLALSRLADRLDREDTRIHSHDEAWR